MYPFIHIGPWAVSSYQAGLMLAFALGVYLAVSLPSLRISLNITAAVLIPILVFALMGAKLMFVLVEGGDAHDIPRIWRGGYYHHGGLAGGVSGYVVYLWLTGNHIRDGLDWAAPFAALGEAVARCGCFLAGCCFGRPTYAPSAVVYPPHSHVWQRHVAAGNLDADALQSMPVHPAPLYAALVMLALYVALRALQPRRRFPGHVALAYLLTHSLSRIALEFFRDDMPRHAIGWTTTQITSACIALAAVCMLLWQYGKQYAYPTSPIAGTRTQEEHP